MQPRASGAPVYSYSVQPQRQVVTSTAQGAIPGAVRPAGVVVRPATVMQMGGISAGSPRIFSVPVGATTMQMQPRYSASSPTIIRSGATLPAGYVQQPQSPSVIRPATVIQSGGPVIRSMQVTPTTRPNVLAGPGYTQGAYEVKHKDDDPQLQNLKELRKTSGLKEVPVEEGLKTMKMASQDGKLTREQFLEAYKSILTVHGVSIPTSEVQNSVFDLFDRDDNGIVDLMELICGVSLLCAGTEDDKIHAVFNIFDENGDGFISMDEMYKFLTSVFKVVLTPGVIGVMNSMGVQVESPEDLASVTALECFKTSDLNHDGKLSVAEFKNWFYAPRNDPSFLFSPVRKMLS